MIFSGRKKKMKMSKKNNLDEMQEQELLKIEHNGYWLAFWGLLTAIVAEVIFFGPVDFKTLAGEWIVFMVMTVYLAIACCRRGIWDRHLQMNTKTNLITSAIAALALSAIMGLAKPAGTAATMLISAVITFVLCFAALSVAMKQTKKKNAELEKEPDEQ